MDMPIPKGRGFTPFPFGRCQVCGAEATGNHYGANTCEGCKGFFKRSLPVFRTFRCFFGNKCDVSPDTRNRCKACRFRKCVDAGMALDAVKMGRIPKTVKEQAIEGTTSSSSRTAGSDTPAHSSSASLTGGAASTSGASSAGSSNRESNSQSVPDRGYSVIRPVHHLLTGQKEHEKLDTPSRSLQISAAAFTTPQSDRFHPYQSQRPTGRDGNEDPGSFSEQHSSMHHSGGQRPSSAGKVRRSAIGSVDRLEIAKKNTDPNLATPYKFQPDTTEAESFNESSLAQRGFIVGVSSGCCFTGSGGFCQPVPNKSIPSDLPSASAVRRILFTNAKVRTIADMALAGQTIDENESNFESLPEDLVRTSMANEETGVAVVEPSAQGNNDCAPVVPRDVHLFRPSYVAPENSSRDFSTSQILPRTYGRHRKGGSMSPSVISYAGPQIRIPSSPTVSFFAELAHNEALRIAMCEHTFKSVSLKNNEIYGEETRVNEVFLRQTLTTGLVPHQPERTPQQMRDILKDRLITQVKRVVWLSENIPGFRNLDLNDQHSLLRTCILDVWMVHSARFLRQGESYLIFLETNTFYARYWMEFFLTDEFLTTVFETAGRINALDLSFDELALLKCVLIARPDRPDLHNREFVTVLHNHLLDSLKLAVRARRPVESGQLLLDLMEMLKGWRVLDIMQDKYVHPIDLSHFSRGPWKVGQQPSPESPSSTNSVAGRGSSPSRRPIQQMTSTESSSSNLNDNI